MMDAHVLLKMSNQTYFLEFVVKKIQIKYNFYTYVVENLQHHMIFAYLSLKISKLNMISGH
jgi:hypothetical protein